MKLGRSPTEAKRLAVQQGSPVEEWKFYIDPDCPYAKRHAERCDRCRGPKPWMLALCEKCAKERA